MKEKYLTITRLIERLHRQFLETVKGELERLGHYDISNVQALILYNIGEDELTVGELTNRGYYLGSNVSYNVRKLVQNGYLSQERSTHDRRSIRVRLSEKGLAVCRQMADIIDGQSTKLAETGMNEEQLHFTCTVLGRLERFLLHIYGYKAPR